MKTTATTEAVSSPLEENELWSQQWRQNTSHAGQKPRADWKNVLQIPGAGRKSRKPPTPFVGYKPNGKSQYTSQFAPTLGLGSAIDDNPPGPWGGAAPVPLPETSTVMAGALMLIPFGIGAIRSLRKDRTA